MANSNPNSFSGTFDGTDWYGAADRSTNSCPSASTVPSPSLDRYIFSFSNIPAPTYPSYSYTSAFGPRSMSTAGPNSNEDSFSQDGYPVDFQNTMAPPHGRLNGNLAENGYTSGQYGSPARSRDMMAPSTQQLSRNSSTNEYSSSGFGPQAESDNVMASSDEQFDGNFTLGQNVDHPNHNSQHIPRPQTSGSQYGELSWMSQSNPARAPVEDDDEADDDEDDEDEDNDTIPQPVYQYEGDIDDLMAFIEARNSRYRVNGGLSEKQPGVIQATRVLALQIFNAFLQTDEVIDELIGNGKPTTAVDWMMKGYWDHDTLWKASWKIVMDCYHAETGAELGVTVHETVGRGKKQKKVPKQTIITQPYPEFDARFKEVHRVISTSKAFCKQWLLEETKSCQLRLVAAPEEILPAKKREQDCNNKRKAAKNMAKGTSQPKRKTVRRTESAAKSRSVAVSQGTRVHRNATHGHNEDVDLGSDMGNGPALMMPSSPPAVVHHPNSYNQSANGDSFGAKLPEHSNFQNQNRLGRQNRMQNRRNTAASTSSGGYFRGGAESQAGTVPPPASQPTYGTRQGSSSFQHQPRNDQSNSFAALV